MSLLMDALKKAELAKRQGSGDAELEMVHMDEPFSLAPVENSGKSQPEATEQDMRLPKLPERLEDLDHQFFSRSQKEPSIAPNRPLFTSDQTHTLPPSPPVRPQTTTPAQEKPPPRPSVGADNTKSRAEQTSAQNLFSAKTDTPPVKHKRAFAIAIGVTTLLSTLAIGGYFWWQLQPKSGLVPMQTTAPMPAPTVAAAPRPTASLPTIASTNAAVSPAPTFSPPPAAIVPNPNSVADNDENELRRTNKSVPSRRMAESLNAPPHPDSPVQITRAPLRVNPALARGYELFERGELAAARQEYERVLKADPQSIDALHGMAAISLRENRNDAADHYFQRVLIADPQDAHAIAGLTNLRGRNNPAVAESRLKNVVAAQPDLAAPQFALGNLLASQERWSEAQQAYFKAYSAEPGNPDILFNLAISLEHLRQAKLAAQYYGLAIEAAGRRPAAFDAAQAAARLKALQQP